ncbi:unnamed protein product [Phytophthora fragariaefolia]|uniref:Unnamed protein product n=1 Tax=Phytophthora fragariaefolia TaxID=1490495 RepID=A0A9W7D017_9STRA|nr:unnamed protein product [Phytophthora fragariaefolia]
MLVAKMLVWNLKRVSQVYRARKADAVFDSGKDFSVAKEFDDVSVEADVQAARPTSPENRPADIHFDEQFDEIFGDTSATPAFTSETLASDACIEKKQSSFAAPSGTYDQEFDEIFGESEHRQAQASDTSLDTDLTSTTNANEDGVQKSTIEPTAFSEEVRTGTPASDYSFR